jgi:hypothetical protein
MASLLARLRALREAWTPPIAAAPAGSGRLSPADFLAAGDALVWRAPMWRWEGGEEGGARAFLPRSRQFLAARRLPCRARAASLAAELLGGEAAADEAAAPSGEERAGGDSGGLEQSGERHDWVSLSTARPSIGPGGGARSPIGPGGGAHPPTPIGPGGDARSRGAAPAGDLGAAGDSFGAAQPSLPPIEDDFADLASFAGAGIRAVLDPAEYRSHGGEGGRGPAAEAGGGEGGRGPAAEAGDGEGGRGPAAEAGGGEGGRGPAAEAGGASATTQSAGDDRHSEAFGRTPARAESPLGGGPRAHGGRPASGAATPPPSTPAPAPAPAPSARSEPALRL